MSKRGPQSELTDRNWDDEEEAEDPGIFVQATKDTIQQRVIKKAKRRGEEGGTGAKTGAFGGFVGFGKTSSVVSTEGKASSGSDSSQAKTNSSGGATSSVEKVEPSKNNSKENSAYLVGLKSLNECVLAWIKQHVDSNPYIILTPIFRDYEKYYANLQAKKDMASNGPSSVFTDHANAMKAGGGQAFGSTFSKEPLGDAAESKKGDGKGEDGAPSKTTPFSFGAVTSNGEGFKFSSNSTTSSSGFTFGKTSAAPSSGFSFAQSSSTSSTPAATTTTSAPTGFSFGGGLTSSTTSSFGGSTTSSATSGFGSSTPSSTTSGFGGSGFSFGALAAKTMAQGASGTGGPSGEDEEYVPPKTEVTEIKEDGSLYSKRCKLFYQKEGGWKERGLGNIHLKPMDGDKTQILVRADTNLGNILLNIMLTSGLPVSRQGKNNILLVCVPNPPLKEGQEDQTPIPMLIRVKSGEEADELLAKMEERKALL